MPINYVVDYVTVEKLGLDGYWDLKAVYSPEAWKLSQGFDYCQMLYKELDRLREQLDAQFTWELQRKSMASNANWNSRTRPSSRYPRRSASRGCKSLLLSDHSMRRAQHVSS